MCHVVTDTASGLRVSKHIRFSEADRWNSDLFDYSRHLFLICQAQH